MMKPVVAVDDFAKIDIRIGRVIEVEDFPGARKPLYKLKIDFGALGVKQSAAGLTPFYKRNELMGRLVVAVINFPPRQIANFSSECLILGAITDGGEVILLQPDKQAPLGAKIA